MADLQAVSTGAGVPEWWTQAVVVEYLDCRRFARAQEIWEFDFSLISDAELSVALDSSRVLIGDGVFHNVRPESLRTRMIGGLVGAPMSRLSKQVDHAIPEGPIGAHAIHLLGNPIDVWDPKLSLGTHVLVRDDDGTLYQWQFATFVVSIRKSCGYRK